MDRTYSQLLASSTFCFVLPGDGFSPRFEDAVQHGWVPADVQLPQPFARTTLSRPHGRSLAWRGLVGLGAWHVEPRGGAAPALALVPPRLPGPHRCLRLRLSRAAAASP